MKSRLHTPRSRRPTPTLLACALAGCLATLSPVALAQTTSATLRGSVTANAAPAAGATVTATNIETGFSRSVTAQANGAYVLNGLPPGVYRVDVSANGQTSSRTLTLQVGQTATVPLAVAGASTALDAVVVRGVSLPETKTSEVATYVTEKQIDALPQGSRNFLAFADTVPGMAFSQDNNGTTSTLRGGGQNSNAINVFIDGVGQKNYVVKGGITGQDSSRGNPFPQLGIAEYKVITSNYKAELDQLSSAAIVAVTKSGTNEFHGDVFIDYTDSGLREKRPVEIAAGAEADTFEKHYGFAIGGPIIKDVAHFFFTYEHKDFEQPVNFVLLSPFTIEDLPAQFQGLATATTTSPFEEDLYFGKVDWALSDEHLLEFTAKHRTENELTGIGNSNTIEYGTTRDVEDTRLDLRWLWSAENWLNDFHLTYEDAMFAPRAVTEAPGYILTDGDRGRVILNAGGGRDYQDKGQKGWAIQNDLTFNAFDWNGSHTIKMGGKFKLVEINAFEQQPFNPQFFYDINQDLSVPYFVQFGAVTGGGDRNITSRNRQLGLYIQDDWEVNEHLLLNIGVRWDYEVSPGYLDYETPAGLVTALRGWSNVHGPNVDYDIEDYISDGSSREAFKGAFQPRVGFSYDIDADQRHVIFGGAGRAYDRNLWDYLALEQSKSTFPTYEFQFNVPGHPCNLGGTCIAWDPSYLDPDNLAELVAANPNLGVEVNLMHNDLKTPYSDQFSLGMRNIFGMFGVQWNSSVTLLHVKSHDGIVFSLGNRWPDGSFRNPANPNATWGGQPWGFPIPGYGTLIKADNGIETKLDSVLLSLEKPYSEASGWGVTFAYTYSNAYENRNNAYNSDEHYIFDYPNPDEEGFHPSIGLPKHRLVATGIWDGPAGFTFSAKLALASGKPKEKLNCHDVPSFDNCFWDRFTPGYAIASKQLDLSAQKDWDFGEDMSLRFRADLLNAFDWHNWTDYDTWAGGPTDTNVNYGRRNGLGQEWPPRMLKLTLGFRW